MPQLWKLLREKLKTSAALTLFLTAFCSYCYFYQGTGQNEAARLDSIRAFTEGGGFIIDRFVYNSADVIKYDGHYYSGKAPGTFYLGLIPFFVTERALWLAGLEEDYRYHWACYAANCFSISMLGALIVVLIFWLGRRLKASAADSAVVALTIGLGTMIFPFSTLFFSHVAAAFCFILAFYQLVAYNQAKEYAQPDRWRLWTAGAALGFSVVLEYPSAIGVVLISAYALANFIKDRRSLSDIARFILGIFAGIFPLFLYNTLAFHNPFYVTYEAYAQNDSAFAAHKQGVLGIRVPLWDWEAWPQFFSNLEQITIKPLRGFFFVSPVLVMAMVGFVIFLRKRGREAVGGWYEQALALLIFLAFLSFNASFGNSITYWGGGTSFGPRYLIVTLPFLALPLLQCLQIPRIRPAIYPLAFLSVFIALMATAVEPRTPYFPENPWFIFYWPRFSSGMLAVNDAGVFSMAPLTANTVAFNYGKLFGFIPALQLVPLYLFWLFMMWRLDSLTRDGQPCGFLFAVGIFVFVLAWIPLAVLS